MKRHGAKALAVTALILAAALVSGFSRGGAPPRRAALSLAAQAADRLLAVPADTLREVVLAEIRDYYDDLSARDWGRLSRRTSGPGRRSRPCGSLPEKTTRGS